MGAPKKGGHSMIDGASRVDGGRGTARGRAARTKRSPPPAPEARDRPPSADRRRKPPHKSSGYFLQSAGQEAAMQSQAALLYLSGRPQKRAKIRSCAWY